MDTPMLRSQMSGGSNAFFERCVAQGYYETLSPEGSLLDCEGLWQSDYADYIGKVDRIQFKVKTPPSADLRNIKVSRPQP